MSARTSSSLPEEGTDKGSCQNQYRFYWSPVNVLNWDKWLFNNTPVRAHFIKGYGCIVSGRRLIFCHLIIIVLYFVVLKRIPNTFVLLDTSFT